MNKRGFTLIEIIAIIILLSVIALITYPVINNLITEGKEKLYEKQINELERLSNTWVTNNINKLKTKDGYVYDLSFEELNEQGFTSDKQIKNPKTGKNLTGCMKVTYNSSKKGYDVAYDESCTTSGEAKEETDLACFKFEPYNDSGVEIKNGSLVGFKCYEGNSEGLPVVKDVVIPNSVVTIRNYAFMWKGLTSVDFSRATNLKTIENAVFGGNQLTSVTIPSSVTTIKGSFVSNQLTSVDFSKATNLTIIEGGAFSDNQLTSVEIPSSVTTIGNDAFSDNQLTSIIIPDSVKTIGDNAFSHNKLTSITIPDSVTTIGAKAFNDNQFPDSQAFLFKRTDSNNDGIAEIDTSTLIGYGGAKRSGVVIPNSVTTIGSYAFLQNKLISVEIPNSVTTIVSNAFTNNQLVNVTIPNSVKTIGNDAFSTNYSLKSITIDKEEGSIEGSPWGALSSTTITWKR